MEISIAVVLFCGLIMTCAQLSWTKIDPEQIGGEWFSGSWHVRVSGNEVNRRAWIGFEEDTCRSLFDGAKDKGTYDTDGAVAELICEGGETTVVPTEQLSVTSLCCTTTITS